MRSIFAFFALKFFDEDKITDIFPDKITDKLSKTELEFLQNIVGYLENNGTIDNYRAQLLTDKSKHGDAVSNALSNSV